jgi:hypothetical protein
LTKYTNVDWLVVPPSRGRQFFGPGAVAVMGLRRDLTARMRVLVKEENWTQAQGARFNWPWIESAARAAVSTKLSQKNSKASVPTLLNLRRIFYARGGMKSEVASVVTINVFVIPLGWYKILYVKGVNGERKRDPLSWFFL